MLTIQNFDSLTCNLKLITIFTFISLLVAIPLVQVYALQQTANTVILDINPGQTLTFQWGLTSDDEEKDITVVLTAEGEGAEFLSFPESIEIPPEQREMLTIVVSIPEDYPGGIKLKPILFGTEYGNAVVANTSINVRMGKTVNLNIGLNENSDLWVDWDKIKNMQSNMSLAETPVPIEEKSESMPKEGGGCLIATAAFGSELAPQIQQLREIRDNIVLNTQSGTAFMTGFNQFYYSFSPTIADLERENPVFKELVKITITPMLTTFSILNYVDVDSEEELQSLGIAIITLNLGIYFAAPTTFVFYVHKHLKRRLSN